MIPRHRCRKQHKTYNTLARCLWRHALWIVGNGPIAGLAHCGELTIQLHLFEEDAWQGLIADQFCGSDCVGRHETVIIDLPMAVAA